MQFSRDIQSSNVLLCLHMRAYTYAHNFRTQFNFLIITIIIKKYLVNIDESLMTYIRKFNAIDH